jgi:L-asparaginase II
MQAPLVIEVVRGDMVESRHHVAVAVADAAGKLALSLGDVDAPVYARSAVKPIQALPLLETGAAERFHLGAREIALACASHHGEKAHVAAVGAWLDRVGLSERDLECGTHLPYDVPSAHALLRDGRAPCPLHSNCSGKHSGFLTTAVHRGEATRGYIEHDHPVQQRVTRALAELCGVDLARAPRGRDGCGIPTLGIPLRAIAHGMARMADPEKLPAERAHAARRIGDAMAAEPLMVDGTGGFATDVMRAAGEAVRVKPGAEGVFCGMLPKLGLGIALKALDGAGRASEAATAAVLRKLSALTQAEATMLGRHLEPVIKNVAGVHVGMIRAVFP